MARPWSPERRVVLIDLDGKDRIEVMRDRFLLDEPGALQWREPDTLWMIGTSVNPFGGMSFVSGRVLHSYDLRTRQHKTLAASHTTERMPILTGSGASFLVSRSEEHTPELQSLMRISYDVFCLKKKNT